MYKEKGKVGWRRREGSGLALPENMVVGMGMEVGKTQP